MDVSGDVVGFVPEEINTGEPTRSARLKWIVAVDSTLPAGRATNAAVCVAAATGVAVAGLLGPDAEDGAGSVHPGLPWAGCMVLGATPIQLIELRATSVAAEGVFVADMPADAQLTRVYDEYLDQVGGKAAEAIAYHAVSVVGPRNRIDKLAKRLALLP